MVIESADGRELFGHELGGNVICYAGETLVFHCGKNSVGFIKKIVEFCLTVDWLAVVYDRIIFGHVKRCIGNDGAVYLDAAFGDLIPDL